MPFNGSGVFNRLYSWVADKNAGIDISSTRMDADTDDITSNGLGLCLTRDGQGIAIANLPMGTFRHTNVGDGVARSDYAAFGQVQDSGSQWGGTSGGTAGAWTVTLVPAISAYVSGQTFRWIAGSDAAGDDTFNINGVGAENAYVMTPSGVAQPSAGAWSAGQMLEAVYNAALNSGAGGFQVQQVINAPGIGWAVAGGTANAITATYSPANTALVDGLILGFRASAANSTTTPTFAPDGLTAHTITKKGGAALIAGDIPAALAECLVRYNLANTRWELLNPATLSSYHDQVFTGSSTFTTPSNTLPTTLFKFTVVGGGAGGGGAAAECGSASGGGSGATALYYVSGLTASQSCAVTVGAAAAGGTAGANPGTAGNASSVVVGSTTITANGGAAGNTTASSAAPVGAAGGTASNGTINIAGGYGAAGQHGLTSGSEFFLFPTGGQGGASSFGGGGAGGPSGNAGSTGVAPGSGGGGGGPSVAGNAAGGDGAAGIVIVEWVL